MLPFEQFRKCGLQSIAMILFISLAVTSGIIATIKYASVIRYCPKL